MAGPPPNRTSGLKLATSSPTNTAILILSPFALMRSSGELAPNSASPRAKTPPRNPLQVTDSLRDGDLVPVRGYDKECSPDVEFVGIAT